jgi:hypothetical protein
MNRQNTRVQKIFILVPIIMHFQASPILNHCEHCQMCPQTASWQGIYCIRLQYVLSLPRSISCCNVVGLEGNVIKRNLENSEEINFIISGNIFLFYISISMQVNIHHRHLNVIIIPFTSIVFAPQNFLNLLTLWRRATHIWVVPHS